MQLMKLFCHSCLSNISKPTLKPLIGYIMTIVQPPSEHVAQAFLRKVRRVFVVSLNLIQSVYRHTKLHSQLFPFSCYRELYEILQCGGRNSHRGRKCEVEACRTSEGGGKKLLECGKASLVSRLVPRSNSSTSLGSLTRRVSMLRFVYRKSVLVKRESWRVLHGLRQSSGAAEMEASSLRVL